jgi:transcription termination factor NusB
MGTRRKARAVILQALYEIDSSKHNADEVVSRLLLDKELSEENEAFVRQQVIALSRIKSSSMSTSGASPPPGPSTAFDNSRNILSLQYSSF